jgi:twitching motility protein PilT
MDRFKTILRNAVANADFKVSLVVGRQPHVTGTKGEGNIKDFGVVDVKWLQSIFNFLFQKEIARINQGLVTKGILNIPNLGRVLLIGQRSEESFLNLYLPPDGEFRYQRDLGEYENAAKVRQELAQPPGLPGKFMNPGGTIPLSPAFPQGSDNEPSLAKPNPFKMTSVPDSGQMGTLKAEDELPLPNPVAFQPFEPKVAAPPVIQDDEEVEVYQIGHGNDMAPTEAPMSFQISQPLAMPKAAPSNQERVQLERPRFAQEDSQETGSGVPILNNDGGASSSGQNAVDSILKEMIARRASDVHLVLGQPVIFRVDGSITRVGDRPIDGQMMEQFLTPILPDRNRAEVKEISDTDFAYQIDGVGRFRVNVFRNNRGIGIVMRHIPATILTAEQLKLPPVILNFCKLNKGLVLVTGPTGSGKSTTLAAMLDTINKTRSDHLLTIEDPIEFVHTQQKCLVNQREVGRHTKSFSRALKAALREDPDIILIGEMRDLETIHIAIETAETGHLVFGTLHTTTAVSTIDRIIDQFPSDQQGQIRMMLASSLRGVVAQTLLKKKGGGRVAAHEILVMNDAVANMIREEKGHMISNHMQTQKADGNMLLNESLAGLVAAGTVDVEEAWLKSVDKKTFVEILKRRGVPNYQLEAIAGKAAS